MTTTRRFMCNLDALPFRWECDCGAIIEGTTEQDVIARSDRHDCGDDEDAP